MERLLEVGATEGEVFIGGPVTGYYRMTAAEARTTAEALQAAANYLETGDESACLDLAEVNRARMHDVVQAARDVAGEVAGERAASGEGSGSDA
jgi:hypothetical protein